MYPRPYICEYMHSKVWLNKLTAIKLLRKMLVTLTGWQPSLKTSKDIIDLYQKTFSNPDFNEAITMYHTIAVVGLVIAIYKHDFEELGRMKEQFEIDEFVINTTQYMKFAFQINSILNADKTVYS